MQIAKVKAFHFLISEGTLFCLSLAFAYTKVNVILELTLEAEWKVGSLFAVMAV